MDVRVVGGNFSNSDGIDGRNIISMCVCMVYICFIYVPMKTGLQNSNRLPLPGPCRVPCRCGKLSAERPIVASIPTVWSF